MSTYKIGFAMCGSFCTFSKVIPQLSCLKEAGYEIIPLMSPAAAFTDTRFGTAEHFRGEVEDICQSKIITEIKDAEPFGPSKLNDALIIAPCTGNTLGKLANGITDTCVTMAAKSTLRNNRPVIIAVSTNDALSSSAKNIGTLLSIKGYYFVPAAQDNPAGKPCSVVALFELIPETLKNALCSKQLQPLLREKSG